jgi:hypothetical protein
MDRCGRRTSSCGRRAACFFSCIVIVLGLLGYLSKLTALFAVNAYVIFFEFGLGPIMVSAVKCLIGVLDFGDRGLS